MFYKIKKKKYEKENDTSCSDAAKSESEPSNVSKPRRQTMMFYPRMRMTYPMDGSRIRLNFLTMGRLAHPLMH